MKRFERDVFRQRRVVEFYNTRRCDWYSSGNYLGTSPVGVFDGMEVPLASQAAVVARLARSVLWHRDRFGPCGDNFVAFFQKRLASELGYTDGKRDIVTMCAEVLGSKNRTVTATEFIAKQKQLIEREMEQHVVDQYVAQKFGTLTKVT